jgi:hypothetical protein
MSNPVVLMIDDEPVHRLTLGRMDVESRTVAQMPMYVFGEYGTCKELAMRLIYLSGARAEGNETPPRSVSE